jgi:transposase
MQKSSIVKTGKSSILQIRQRRIFSESFKREKVGELVSGVYSIGTFCKLWSVKPTNVYRWIYKYSSYHKQGTTMVVQKESEAKQAEGLHARIAELERSLGQKQMALDYLEKLVEIASEELEVDIKKKYKPVL